jgi:hypothetical protein
MLGLLAVGYWGAVATLVGSRTKPADDVPVSLMRPPGSPPLHLRGHMLPLEPAWAPHPRPRVLGLAQGTPPAIPVDPAETQPPARAHRR